MSKSSTSSSDVALGLLFWVLVIAAGVYFFTRENRGEILLDVSTQPELISGAVIFEGVPVHEGTLHVVVAEARSRRYRAGITLPVKNGRFSSQGQPPLGFADNDRAWRITAAFHGTAVEKDDGKRKITAVTGDTTRYLNTSPPLGGRFLWIGAIIVGTLLFSQLVLFTGDLGPKKARLLFVLMYFFTFFSLALPILVSLVVALQEDLVHSMEASPIGLVKAKPAASESSEQQWLVNIGGRVRSARVENTTRPETASAAGAPNERAVESDEAAAPEVETTPAAGSASDVPSEGTAGSDAAQPQAAGTATAPANPGGTRGTGEAGEEIVKVVEGGIAVPFYVVLLAMFGAGINMTLKVPVIQRSYEDVLPEDRTSLWLNPLAAPWRLLRGQPEVPAAVVPRKTAGDIRRDLIENFMSLLSAPLLAIAMYYLLQVLAEEVTQPVLVLMAFATGLVSKAVVGGIIQFAESRLLTAREREVEPSELADAVAKAQAKQAEAETAQRALEDARINLAAADAAARTAEEAVQKADAMTSGDSETAKREAEKTAQEAAAKREEAQEAATIAEQRAEEKQAEANKAVSAAEQAQLREIEAAAKAAQQAEGKQAEARAAAEATEQAAKAATAKQAAAQQAVSAVVQPQQEAAEDAGSLQRNH